MGGTAGVAENVRFRGVDGDDDARVGPRRAGAHGQICIFLGRADVTLVAQTNKLTGGVEVGTSEGCQSRGRRKVSQGFGRVALQRCGLAVNIEIVSVAVGERATSVTASLPVGVTSPAVMPVAREIGVGGGAGIATKTETGSRNSRSNRQCNDARRAFSFLRKRV